MSRKPKAVESSSDEEEIDRYSVASESSINLSDIEQNLEEEDEQNVSKKVVAHDSFLPAKHTFVIVNYEGEYWPGQVTKVETNGAYVRCMARSGTLWRWPEKEDCLFYHQEDIIESISKPQQKSTKRELFHVPELEVIWGKPKK